MCPPAHGKVHVKKGGLHVASNLNLQSVSSLALRALMIGYLGSWSLSIVAGFSRQKGMSVVALGEEVNQHRYISMSEPFAFQSSLLLQYCNIPQLYLTRNSQLVDCLSKVHPSDPLVTPQQLQLQTKTFDISS